MSRVCQVTGKRPATGNNVSHAHNKTRRRFSPNLHYRRFWVESENRLVRLRVSAKGIRIIDKLGIEEVLKRIGKTGKAGKAGRTGTTAQTAQTGETDEEAGKQQKQTDHQISEQG